MDTGDSLGKIKWTQAKCLEYFVRLLRTERQRRPQEVPRYALELASSGSNGGKSAVTLLSCESHPLRAWARHGGPL